MPLTQLRLLGNDVVDRQSTEPPLHSRYLARVCTARERSHIEEGLPLALFWAAKEAAYKALRRYDPELVFAHSQFELDPHAQVVTYKDYPLPCHVRLTQEYAHVVAGDQETIATCADSLLALSCAPQEDAASFEARLLAIRTIASRFGIAEEDVLIPASTKSRESGGAPIVLVSGQPTEILLSLSHHGRFVACAVGGGDLAIHPTARLIPSEE